MTDSASPIYFFTIFPDIFIKGMVNGLEVKDHYQPEIAFQIDSNMMRFLDQEESLDLSLERSLINSREMNNFLLIFGRMIDIKSARLIAVIGLGLSLLGAIFPTRSLIMELRESDVSRIRAQYHTLIIDVEKGSSKTKGSHVIEVASLQELIKMADRYGTLILHESRGKTHHYSIQDEGTLYRYSMVQSTLPGGEV